MSSHYQSIRSGLNYYQLKELTSQIMFNQDYFCPQCKGHLIHHTDTYELHHLDSNPKNNHLWNLQVLHVKCHIDIRGDN